MKIFALFFVISAISLIPLTHSLHAGGGSILGLSPDAAELELYKTPQDEDAAHILDAGSLSFPTAILGVSENGMYKIRHGGAEYWVISDDVKTDSARKIETQCEPKLAGTVVAHGKRGVGEGCQ